MSVRQYSLVLGKTHPEDDVPSEILETAGDSLDLWLQGIQAQVATAFPGLTLRIDRQ